MELSFREFSVMQYFFHGIFHFLESIYFPEIFNFMEKNFPEICFHEIFFMKFSFLEKKVMENSCSHTVVCARLPPLFQGWVQIWQLVENGWVEK